MWLVVTLKGVVSYERRVNGCAWLVVTLGRSVVTGEGVVSCDAKGCGQFWEKRLHKMGVHGWL